MEPSLTCIVAGFEGQGGDRDPHRIARLLAAARWRGSDEVATEAFEDGFLGVARDQWETAEGLAGSVLLGRAGSVVVCSDASLYFRRELEEKLKGEGCAPRSLNPADLIAAAILAFGDDCVLHLEGDYAFCAWDVARRSLFAARDIFGPRALFFRRMDDAVLVHSSAVALAGVGRAPPPFDPAGVFSALMAIPGDGSRTAWEGIRELPAGCLLKASAAGLQVLRFSNRDELWRGQRPARHEAADVVARQIITSTAERSPPSGAGLALSGGQDSSAVLAGLRARSSPAAGRDLSILSIDYPEDDPGYERPWIDLAADHFGLGVKWVGYEEIRAQRWLEQDQDHHSHPGRYPFNGVQQTMGLRGLAEGHRVFLTGRGGDNLFHTSSHLVLAEHFRRLRPLAWARSFRHSKTTGLWQALYTSALLNLHPQGIRILEGITRKPLTVRPGNRRLPPWIHGSSGAVREVLAADTTGFDELRGAKGWVPAWAWRGWSMLDSRFSRFSATLFDDLRAKGLEARAPLLDLRLARLLRRIPPDWLYRPKEPKALLRDAMRPYLPSEFLEVRGGGDRTGTAEGLMRELFLRDIQDLLTQELGRKESWVTEELGLVRRSGLGGILDEDTHPEASAWALVVRALSVEWWLRAHWE